VRELAVYEDHEFYQGPSWISLDGRLWVKTSNPAGRFMLLLSFLCWAARGAPMSVVTAVDEESGTVTIEAL
jgi:hypothetical protein